LDSASDLFEVGSLKNSDTNTSCQFDGLEFQCENWHVESLDVAKIQSSDFEDQSRYPKGSVEFDCVLLIWDIVYEWHGRASLGISQEIGA
ncbi:MAG: hypothetical protein P8J33_01875, partial [Pirellulaceae bacterium]|nr:hypothetical protein [Pirellulaceae bacterium]